MKVINLLEDPKYREKSMSAMYAGVPMPLVTYHSTEELRQNIGLTRTVILKTSLQFLTYITQNNFTQLGETYRVYNDSVFLATGEKYVPDVCDPNDSIIYKLDENGKLIPTDDVYIQLYAFRGINNYWEVATSAGIFHIGSLSWKLTGAPKVQFARMFSAAYQSRKSKAYRVEKLKNKKMPTTQDIRFVHYLINKESQFFMNPYKAAKAAYGQDFRKDELSQIVETARIKKLITRELNMIIPSLMEAVQKLYPPDELARDVKDFTQTTIKDNKVGVDDKLKAIKYAVELGYEATPKISEQQDVPLIAGSTPQMGQITIRSEDEILPPVDRRQVKRMVDGKMKLTKEAREKLMEETGTPENYMITDYEEDDEKDVPPKTS